MDKLLVEGPCKLSGSVKISRSKNAYLPIIAAVLLNPNPVHLKNLPELRDIRTILKLLEKLGVKITKNGNLTTLDASNITSYEALYEMVKTMRASILVLGPLLARFKTAKVSLPGGCAIGTRPIDIHLSNFEKLGAKISLEGGYVEAQTKGLKGTTLVLKFPSVGATENLMMAAVLSEGETIIENAALEPEIIDLGNFLIKMGANISGLGSSIISIKGVKTLHEAEYEAIGDRIEAATYIMAGLITNSSIKVEGFDPKHLDAVLNVLEEMGGKFEIGKDFIVVKSGALKAVKIDTTPFPGFPTDAQAQIMALATQANGSTIITEKIFENRFMHAPELQRLGANIFLKGNTAIIEGKSDLKGAQVMCTDLRASAALVLAALASKGNTEIDRIYHLERGYEKMEEKLLNLGAKIKRIK
jgi:UDP-N-acetylglucosamine 1-carboxyvinyltransferase